MYRIVEEKRTITGTSKFYIEKYRKFLWWKWWSKLETYIGATDITVYLSFDTLEEAKKELDRLNDKIEVIIHK